MSLSIERTIDLLDNNKRKKEEEDDDEEVGEGEENAGTTA